MKPWRASPTSMELFQDCPFAFSMKYEVGASEPASDPLLLGQLLAMTIEAYLTHCAANKVRTDVTEIKSIARRVYAERGVGIPLTALDAALEIVERYAMSHAIDLDHLVGTEIWLPVPPATVQLAGRDVLGRVDELYVSDDGTEATVVDAKSNYAIWTVDEARAKLQARVYPYLLFQSFPGLEQVTLVFDFIRWNIERTVVWNRAESMEEGKNLEALIVAMQRPGRRPAVPGARCSYCSFTAMCPTFKSMKADGTSFTPISLDDAVAVAAEITVLEPAIAQRRKALREWTNQRGPVPVHGLEYGYFEHQTPTIDPEKFAVWAKKNGKDPFEYLRIGTTDLRKLLKKHPGLEDLIEYETETKFDARRPEPEAQPV